MLFWVLFLYLPPILNGEPTFHIGPSEGEIIGQFYKKDNGEITVLKTKLTKTFSIDIETLELGTLLQTYVGEIANDLQQKIKDLTAMETDTKESFVVSSTGQLIRITRSVTYQTASERCHELNSTMVEVLDDSTLQEIKDFLKVLQETPTTVTVDKIWQPLETSRAKLPRFEKSRTYLPKNLGALNVTKKLTGLSSRDNCGTFTFSTTTFDTETCTSENKAICISNTNLDDLFQLDITRLHATSLKKQLQNYNTIIKTLLDHLPTATTLPQQTQEIEMINIDETKLLTTLRKLKIPNLSTPTRYNILTFIASFVKQLLRISENLLNKNALQIIHSYQLFDDDSSKIHPTRMSLTKSTTTLIIEIQYVQDKETMQDITLFPLFINDFSPNFMGKVLMSKDDKTCIVNNCAEPFCTIDTENISPCCHVHLLQDFSKGTCDMSSMYKQPFYFTVTTDTVLITSQTKTILKSNNCPIKYTLPDGTIKIKMINDTSECTWKVNDKNILKEGKPVIEILSNKLTFEPHDPTKINISETFDEYIIPISSFIGSVFTITISLMSIYIYVRNKETNTEDNFNNDYDSREPLQLQAIESQQIHNIRPILRNTEQNFPHCSGSESISSTSS